MANLTFDFLHNYVTGERRASDPADAYQYDEGHVLEAVVPVAVTSCEIQYWIRGMEKADAYTPTSITQNTDNTYTILGNIPNSYFETNGDLRVYIVVTDGDASITTYEGYIHIKERQMPEDYVDDDPDNEAVRVIAEAQAAAATATQKAGEAAESAEQAQEILDSIPEDYSQLSEDVSDLKEDLTAVEDDVADLKDGFDEFENNFYDKSVTTGNFVNLISEVEKVVLSASAPITVLHCGKNLLAKPYYHSSPLVNGVQFTYNSDGSVTASGTATANASYVFIQSEDRRPIKKGTYHLSGCPDNLNVALIFSLTGVGDIKDEGEGVMIDVSQDSTYYMRFIVRSGTTINTTIYPMLNYGNETSTWEEYVSENISVNSEVNVHLYEGVNNLISENIFVAETFAAKETNIINLRESGAVGDGVTDDTDALNAALQSAKYKTLYIPKGTYLISGTINVPSDTKVIGCGSESVIKLANVFELTGYNWRNDSQFTTRYPIMITDENSKNCVFKDFSIVGQTSTFVDHDEDGLVVSGSNIVIENVIIHDINYFTEKWSTRTSKTLGFGIFVFNAQTVFVNNSTVYNCGYQDIGIENTNNCTIQGCMCGIANQTGIQVHRNSKNIFIKNNVIDLTGRVNGHACLTIDAPSSVSAENIHVANNYIGGTFITVGGGENRLFLVNNEIIGTVQFNSNFFVDRVVIMGNQIDGRITLWANNTMVCNNIIDNSATSSYMIRIHGTKAVAVNNNAIGEGNGDTYITET